MRCSVIQQNGDIMERTERREALVDGLHLPRSWWDGEISVYLYKHFFLYCQLLRLHLSLSAHKDLLLAWVSFSLSPVAPLFDRRSLPARSTRFSSPAKEHHGQPGQQWRSSLSEYAAFQSAPSSFWPLRALLADTATVNTRCEREERSLQAVAATERLCIAAVRVSPACSGSARSRATDFRCATSAPHAPCVMVCFLPGGGLPAAAAPSHCAFW